ncbi:MAG: SGNH/GDSL hydrolase family protein [Planctomycetia bacterium]|nr:SGNH/GDSL hydrolase family protein [Planctomycetia bacterium]
MAATRPFFAARGMFLIAGRFASVVILGMTWNLVVPLSSAVGGPLTNMIVLGDSLSDTGNVFNNSTVTLFGNTSKAMFPGPAYNYDTGRFTDGTDTKGATNTTGVWHEQLADRLKLGRATASTNATPGNNYAYGGAVTGAGRPTISTPVLLGAGTGSVTIDNLDQQVANFKTSLNGGKADANALYTIWAGGNDLINAGDAAQLNAKSGGTLSNASAADVPAAEMTAVANIKANIDDLYSQGARNIAWPDMPPIDRIPLVQGWKDPTIQDPKINDAIQLVINAEQTAAASFKTDEQAAIAALVAKDMGLKLVLVDVLGLFNNIAANPAGFDFTNITTPAQGLLKDPQVPNQYVNPDTYVFWDRIHPTIRSDQLIAGVAYNALFAVGVPEPRTVVLLGIAAPVLFLWRRATGTKK